MTEPSCPCCGAPIDLAAFRFPDEKENPGGRRAPHDILNRDPRLQNKSLLGDEADRALGYPTSYAGTFRQFVHSALGAPLFGLTDDPAIPAKVRAIFNIAANLVLYSWFVRDFAAVGTLMGYVALEAALRDASGTGDMLGALITKKLDKEALMNVIMRESVIRIFENGGDLPQHWARHVPDQAHLDKWQHQVSDAAKLRSALAHGDKELLSEDICDEAGSRLQFVGEMINRVCAGNFMKEEVMDAKRQVAILANQLDWVQRYLTDLITLLPRPTPESSEAIERKLSVALPFFVMVQHLLFDHVILELCKMVDDKPKGTLTIARLIKQVTDVGERKRLTERIDALPMRPLREARDKLIGHSNIEILSKYPGNAQSENLDISVDDLKMIVSNVTDILKDLARLLGADFQPAYENDGNGRWAHALLDFIGKTQDGV